MKNKPTYHLLPTEDASPIGFIGNSSLFLIDNTKKEVKVEGVPNINFQHLYLVSDAPIKGGNWYLDDDEDEPYKATEDLKADLSLHKIEFTTDPKLIADGVLLIDGNTKAIIANGSFKVVDFKPELNYIEVNFLTEFCNRYNQKDNQKVDVEELAELFYQEHFVSGVWDVSEKSYKAGYNQALQSTGKINLPSNDVLMDIAKARGLTAKQADAWIDGARSVKAMIYEQQENIGKFSLEDMIEFGRSCYSKGQLNDYKWMEKKIQSLTPYSKGEMVIEVEMEEEWIPETKSGDEGYRKIIKLTNGQPTLIFK